MDAKTLSLAALDILTLGNTYHIRKRRTLEKSLRDAAVIGGQYSTPQGGIGVIQTNTPARYPKKQNVRMWRQYSQYNPWVRACMDIYRAYIAHAEMAIVPVDEELDMDRGVVRELEYLFQNPNALGKPYSQIKEEIVEDWHAIGHGVGGLKLMRNLQPYAINTLDAARLGFNIEWNGDQSKPRYCYYALDYNSIEEYIPDPAAMVLMNTSTSYDVLGVSTIEKLDGAVRAQLAADDYLRDQVLNPSPSGLLNLGRGISQPQVDETRQQMNAVKKPLVIIGGTEGVQYTGFTADQSQQQALAANTWFVREACAVFNLPTAAVGLAVDTSRANTEAMLGQADTGLGYALHRVEEMENLSIVGRFGPPQKHNCRVTYPILNQKDESTQADISQKSLNNVAWRSINEVRKSMGDEPLPYTVADEPLVGVDGDGVPIPLSIAETKYVKARQAQAAPVKSYRRRA